MANRQTIAVLFSAAVILAITIVPVASASAAVRWRNNVDAAKVEATQSGKLVLLHFGTKTCGPCQKLERDVFTQPQLGDFVESKFVPVKVDADLSPALSSAYKITRVPADVVITPQGNVVASLSCPMEAGAYANQLNNVSNHYQQFMSKPSAPVQPPMQAAYAGLEVGQYKSQRPVITQGTTPPTTQPAAANTGNPYVSNAAVPPQAQPQQPQFATPPQATQPQNQFVSPAATTAAPAPQGINNPYAQPAQQVSANLPIATQSQQPASGPQVPPQAPATAPAASQAAAQLPPGSPPLAFEGYCPVSLKTARKWVRGNAQFGALHRGRTFLFTDEAQKQKFLANPDAYSPVFSGYDAVLMLEENKAVDGSRKYGYEYRGAFYLFSSQATMDKFAQNPDRYSAQVRQAMNRLDGNLGTVLRR